MYFRTGALENNSEKVLSLVILGENLTPSVPVHL